MPSLVGLLESVAADPIWLSHTMMVLTGPPLQSWRDELAELIAAHEVSDEEIDEALRRVIPLADGHPLRYVALAELTYKAVVDLNAEDFRARAVERVIDARLEEATASSEQSASGSNPEIWLRRATIAVDRAVSLAEAEPLAQLETRLEAYRLGARICYRPIAGPKPPVDAASFQLLARAADLCARHLREIVNAPADYTPEDATPLAYHILSRLRVPWLTHESPGVRERCRKAAVELARVVGDKNAELQATVMLAEHYRDIPNPHLAEEVVAPLVETSLPDELRPSIELLLAACYSEQGRFREAAALQRHVLSLHIDDDDRMRALSDLGNSLARLGDKEEAIGYYEEALKVRDSPGDSRAAQTNMIMAEELIHLGRINHAVAAFERARAVFDAMPPRMTPPQYHTKAAKILEAAGDPDGAIRHLDTAQQSVMASLTDAPSIGIWESRLGYFSTVTANLVRLKLKLNRPSAVKEALTEAEAAKGRLISWLKRFSNPEAPAEALGLQPHIAAIESIETWSREEPGRAVISLFGTDDGTAVFLVDEGGLRARWLPEAAYQLVMTDTYQPWETSLDRCAADPSRRPQAEALTDLLLDRLGRWLLHAHPALADGGTTLIVSPHRLYRSMPLAYARLPDGRFLSDLFDDVYVVPSFHWLTGHMAEPFPSRLDRARAVVNPGGDLPFAEIEALLSFAPEDVAAGGAATRAAFSDAAEGANLLLLSCHGNFDEDNPWRSAVNFCDASLAVLELIAELYDKPNLRMVVLGACEAGRHRRSMSDEPVGFPGLILTYGTSFVVAPLWKVDDLSACLFLTEFFRRLAEGESPSPAAVAAAYHVRDMTAYSARKTLTGWQSRLDSEKQRAQIRRYLDWLEQLAWDVRPFRSPRDWAAFQLSGYATPQSGDHDGS